MADAAPLRVVLVKPSKYGPDGSVERFRLGFMPNSTLPHLASLTPTRVSSHAIRVETVDEYVTTDLRALDGLRGDRGTRTLLALVGVQSHQLHRALDLAAAARSRGVEGCVIGGPHAMTCDTSALQDRGISFALSEAERVWPEILADAAEGDLKPVYGADQRWKAVLDPPVLKPPSRRDLARYAVRMLGVYPARGCPYACTFCSVIRIAGQKIRSQPLETTLATLRAAKAAGVRLVMFTSDNFNKIPDVEELLFGMIEERLELPFFAQCDALVERQPALVSLMARAGCFQMFVGVESFSSATLREVHKFHNTPARYAEIVRLCREACITSHFSNILGFPTDTEDGILHHLDALRSLAPDVASFYVLTPIPGTTQYEEFRHDGRITEKNLDRFDGSCVVWRHPLLAAAALKRLLFRSYREFYAGRDVAKKLARYARRVRDFRRGPGLFAIAGYAAQSRWAARGGRHPMAGGIGQVRLDGEKDFRQVRRRTFGLDRVPLPENLALTPADGQRQISTI